MQIVAQELRDLAAVLADWCTPAPAATLFLFGSRVRGDHRPDSDVDIFIQWGKVTRETAEWWAAQNSEDFASLKAKLPGPLKILDNNAPIVPSIMKAEVVYQDRNVVCVLLPPKFGYCK